MAFQTLSGKYPNFSIKKYFAIDRGRKVAQYIPTYKGTSLVKNPLKNLKDSQSIIEDWQNKIIFYKRTKRKGQIYQMLKKYNMV